ncbi:MAG: hypothetical protein HY299_20950 [Verrucomicrobia bacterium]|nr:hypothetical protein [Verrucomicrobiota bacterium]
MQKLWRALESLSGPVAVQAVWQELLGEDFDAVAQVYLDKTTEKANSYPCQSGCECAHRIVTHDDGQIVGVCQCEPESCSDISLSPADVTLWEFNHRALAGAIIRAFECDWKDGDLGVPRTRQIGAFGAASMPIILTIQYDSNSLRHVVAELAARLGKGFILLAPTSRFLTASSQALLKGAKAGFYDLESCLTVLPNGALQARTKAGVLFSPWLPEQEAPLKTGEAQRVFGLFRKLSSDRRHRKAKLAEVFELTVLQGLSQREAARRCNPRCVPGLISARVREIEQQFGRTIRSLRNFASEIREMETSVKGPRKPHRRGGYNPAEPEAFEQSEADTHKNDSQDEADE